MKAVKLLTLKLENFKGARAFTLEAGGENVAIFGANRAGKSTIADAYQWLLYGRDSLGRVDFGIKTHDRSGASLSRQNHAVEATFDVGGEELTLRRVYKEKWVRKRGAAEEVFDGHVTDYFVDDVPLKKNEYSARVEELAPERIVRLLSDPHHFSRDLSWQQRRELLLEIFGDVTDAEVIASTPKLSPLADILRNRTSDDYRRVLTAQRSEMRRDLDALPIRIDEVTQGLPDIGTHEAELKALERKRKKLEKSLGTRDEDIEQKAQEIRTASVALHELEVAAMQSLKAPLTVLLERESKALIERERLTAKAMEARSARGRHHTEIDALKAERDWLKDQWRNAEGGTFTAPGDDTCPTCGQMLPESTRAENVEKARKDFERSKAGRLDHIGRRGRAIAAEIKERTLSESVLSADISRAEEKLKSLAKTLADIAAERETLKPGDPSPEVVAAQAKLATLQAELAALKAEEDTSHKSEISAIDERVVYLHQEQAQHAVGVKRVEELQQQQRDLSARWDTMERELYLSDELVRARVRLLETRINTGFRRVKFRLYEEQVNGLIAEACVATYEGTPYSDMSGAEKTNSGLDIIDVLGKHYQISLPIWVDNRESVSELLPVENQVISLTVSKKDKVIRVEGAKK